MNEAQWTLWRSRHRGVIFPFLLLTFLCITAGSSFGQLPKKLFVCEKVREPLIGSTIPGLQLHAPDKCGYFGLQYGPKATDVVYLVLDYNKKKGIYDVLYVYVAGHQRYGNTFKIKGSRKRKGIVKFRKFPIQTTFGDINVVLDVELKTHGTTVDVLTQCRLKRDGHELCRFTLHAPRKPGLNADRPAKVTRLMQQPSVTCILDHRSSPPKLSGRLKMGVWNMIPESRMPCKLFATVADENAKFKVRERARLDEKGQGKFKFTPYRPLIPGHTYEGHVTVDLGRILGIIEVTKRLTPRKS